MRKEFFIVCLFFILNSAFGQKNLSGQYQTNFPTYGIFRETLDLNCDSTFTLNFRGDLQNDNTFGKWMVNNDSMTLIVDTFKTKTKRYSRTTTFSVKWGGLYEQKITKVDYLKLQKKVTIHNKETGDALALPKFSEFKLIPINHNGKNRKQFYKKLKSFDCKKIDLQI